MFYRLGADLVFLLHFSFVLFVVFGGLLLIKWPRLIWLHLPAVAWGVFVEFSGWICPLTPLENWLRAQAGAATHTRDFIVRHLSSILYPDALTHEIQLILGATLLAVNLAIYGWLWRTSRRQLFHRGSSLPNHTIVHNLQGRRTRHVAMVMPYL
jgi:hypothetical protein